MPIVQFGEYKPDLADYEATATKNIVNAVPRGDGYAPAFDFSVLTAALPGPCLGSFYALKSDGSVSIFAGTSTGLYKLNNTDQTWISVSGSYAAVPNNRNWAFEQFNNLVIAVQGNISPQVYDLSSSSSFANLGGSPPQANYVRVVGRFLVLSGLTGNATRIQWSGLNDTTQWTSGVNSSDYQDLPDGGLVGPIAGGEQSAIIFQDSAIRRMNYAPGSAVIFQIQRITQEMGLFAPYSVVRSGEKIFFYSAKGFYVIEPGGLPIQIGRERVDRTFFADLDKSSLHYFVGASDPRSSKVFWSYKSASGSVGQHDKIIGYDHTLDRWFTINMHGQLLLGMSQPGLTLEGLDAFFSSIDAMTTSLDAFALSTTPEISQFDTSNRLGFFRGAPLEATLETAEQGNNGGYIFVRGFRPITDASSIFGSASYRETLRAAAAAGTETAMNTRTGRCDMRRSTRYTRLKVRIPAGAQWTYCAGVEPDIVAEGDE